MNISIYIYVNLYKTIIYLYALYRAWQRLSTNYIRHLELSKVSLSKDLFFDITRSLSLKAPSYRLQSSIVDYCYPHVRISVILLLGIAATFDTRGTIISAIIVYAIVAAIAELTAKAAGRLFDRRGAFPAVVDQRHVPALRHGFSHYMLSFAKLLASPPNLDEYEKIAVTACSKIISRFNILLCH